MIAIVIFHHGWMVIPGVTAFFSRFGLWGVDIFLFLSGFGCVYALNKYTTIQFWRKRITRILPTCILVGVLIYCIDLYIHAERTITYLPIRLLSLHRWYIQAILICYLCCPLAYFILKKYKTWGLFTMIVALIALQPFVPADKVWKLSWVIPRMPVFLIGMYIAEFDLKLNRIAYIISGLCLIGAIIIRCWGEDTFLQWPYFLAAAMPFICETLCRIKPIFDKLHLTKVIELMGLYSLEIYLIHEYFYWALYKTSLPLWGKYILFLFIVSTLCFVVKKTTGFILNSLNNLRSNSPHSL